MQVLFTFTSVLGNRTCCRLQSHWDHPVSLLLVVAYANVEYEYVVDVVVCLSMNLG